MKRLQILLLLTILISSVAFGQNGTYTELNHKCKDAKVRPFVVYTPQNIDKNTGKPLLIYLHGAISNPKMKENPLEYMKKSQLVKMAEEGGFYLMFSYGQKDATWFDSVGTSMVLEEIKTVQKQINIDSKKIFLAGFSDGGSGVFYFSMTNPMPFAGFIIMNGSLKVAEQLGKNDLFPENTNQKPMYIINTTKDMLYPISQMKPTIDYLKKFNANVTFKTPEGNHDMSYLEKVERKNILNFIENTVKHKSQEFSWETSSAAKTPMDWLTITKIDTFSLPKEWHKPYQMRVFNDKARLGLKFDYTFRGKGLKVKGFKNDSCTAKSMNVQIDDIILMMENDTMKSFYSPFYYASKKVAGDTTSFIVLRDNKERMIRGKFNEGYYYRIFKDNVKSAKILVKTDKKKLFINTSNIAELSIDRSKIKKLHVDEIYVNDKIQHLKNNNLNLIKIATNIN